MVVVVVVAAVVVAVVVVEVAVRRRRVVILVVSIIVHLEKVEFFNCFITEYGKYGTKKDLLSVLFFAVKMIFRRSNNRPLFSDPII